MTRKLASSGAAFAVVFVLGLTGCPDTKDDEAECGNGVTEVGESCDDGNTFDGDGCSSVCTLEGFCGNGAPEPGEECDDGNFQPGDGCDENCNKEDGCGNGLLEVGESCDDDNLVNGDGCSATCVDEEPGSVCGNGIWEINEGCDDGNTDDGDGCAADCSREDSCGDGVMDVGEECDDGNNVSGDGCYFDCRNEFVPNDGNCDEENAESCEYSPADCCPDCGNGVLDSNEYCDDGNNVSGDGCSQGCLDEDGVADCGNGIWEVGETCDDGNTDAADGCDASCQAEFVCGDGTCDTANHETCALCPGDCCPECGDGGLDTGEQCDGADFGGVSCEDFCYTGGTPSCTTTCQLDLSSCTGTLPTCGDDAAGCDEECDGTDLRGQDCMSLGFESGSLACSSCSFDVSGCQNRLWYLSEDFDDGAPLGWTAHGMWELGTPSSVGPTAAHSGSDCAGTVIAGNYLVNGTFANDWLETPRVDLTGATQPMMLFYAWFGTENQVDGGTLRISEDGGVSFVPVGTANLQPAYNHDNISMEDGWTGALSGAGWRPMVANLAPWIGREVILRFAFYSNNINEDAGWYVDDVLIAEAEDIPVQIINNDPLPTAVTGYPYDVQMGGLGGSGSYDWSITGGTNQTWLSINPTTGALTGTPDASNVGAVNVTIRVEDTANAANFDEQTFTLDVLNALFFEDFEGGATPADWTGFGALFWEWGTPSTVGPAACHGGTSCIATGIASEYMGMTCMMGGCSAITPSIDLTTAVSPVLTFWQYVHFGNPTDGGYVSVTSGSTTDVIANPVPAYNGAAGPMGMGGPAWVGDMSAQGWHLVTIDLSAYTGSTITVSFDVATDLMAMGTGPGWYIDDIMIAD